MKRTEVLNIINFFNEHKTGYVLNELFLDENKKFDPERVINAYETNKVSKITDYFDHVDNIHEQTFHMNDEQAKVVVDDYIAIYPELLRYHNIEWYYKNC